MDPLMPPLSCASLRTGAVKYELPESLERYLMAVLRMENLHSIARVKDIAGELGFKEGSVVGALKKLNALGLIVYPLRDDRLHRLAPAVCGGESSSLQHDNIHNKKFGKKAIIMEQVIQVENLWA
jgi:hypothetical protein